MRRGVEQLFRGAPRPATGCVNSCLLTNFTARLFPTLPKGGRGDLRQDVSVSRFKSPSVPLWQSGKQSGGTLLCGLLGGKFQNDGLT